MVGYGLGFDGLCFFSAHYSILLCSTFSTITVKLVVLTGN